VRHTSNELYVDIIENLSVTIAPSGRLLSALVSGTIAFTAKISGVPDMLLTLSTPGGQQGISRKMELPSFHPCVRLARWRERPGELSFVPPDGRFILAGYETDLMPIDPGLDEAPTHMEKLFLPAFVDVQKSLGPHGTDFEVRLTLNTDFPGSSLSLRQGAGHSGSGTSTPSFLGGGPSSGSSSSPILEEVVVTVSIPKTVRNITDMRPSRGEANYSPGDDILEWHVPTKDAGSISGTATLHCTVVGYQEESVDDNNIESEISAGANLLQGYYDADSYQQDPTTYSSSSYPSEKRTKPRKPKTKSKSGKTTKKSRSSKKDKAAASSSSSAAAVAATTTLDASTSTPEEQPSPSLTPPSGTLSVPAAKSDAARRAQQLKASLMPTSATVSFSVKGWLPSGIRVESLMIDPRRSRGLGEGVRPYKGVKYLCVSRRGVERRC
jgi:AP-3 complex subunit mu